jgi:hypothetical protein
MESPADMRAAWSRYRPGTSHGRAGAVTVTSAFPAPPPMGWRLRQEWLLADSGGVSEQARVVNRLLAGEL